jgi:hypothetical protein
MIARFHEPQTFAARDLPDRDGGPDRLSSPLKKSWGRAVRDWVRDQGAYSRDDARRIVERNATQSTDSRPCRPKGCDILRTIQRQTTVGVSSRYASPPSSSSSTKPLRNATPGLIKRAVRHCLAFAAGLRGAPWRQQPSCRADHGGLFGLNDSPCRRGLGEGPAGRHHLPFPPAAR